MSTQDTASRIFLKPLTLPRDRSDSLLEDTTDDANAEHQGSHPINYPENTNGGPNVACRQSNTAAFVKNSENLVGSEDGELDVHRSLRETTGSAAAERKAFTVPEVDPVHLRTRINEIYQAHPIGLNQEGYYLPDKELRELLNKETIRGAMGEGVDDKLVHFVLEKAPKTFATLQLVFSKPKQRKQAMEAFQNRGFTDEGLDSKNLVVCESSACPQPNEPQTDERQVSKRCSHFFPHFFSHKKLWDNEILGHFKTRRWIFLVPTLDHMQFRYEFDPQRLLPFKVRGDSKKSSSGNFSDVICVDMLAEKQTKFELSLPETIPVAHKTLRPLDVPRYDIHTEWLREAEAHRQLNGINGHLVEGIAAYRRVANSTANDTYHIVLEWADGGNLFSFWNKDTEPQLDGNTARSRERVHLLLKQLCGLAHAVESMHSMRTGTTTSSIQSTGDLSECQHGDTVVTPTDGSSAPAVNVEAPAEDSPSQARHPGPANLSPDSQDARLSPPDSAPRHHSRRASDAKNWRHGDIKPENILRFTGGDNLAWLGTLKLADLGRAQQHDLVTALRSTIEKERWRTRWYEPPDLSEDLHQQAHGKISRLFDIWSMGCVMFESVIWLLYGSSEITRFQKIETLTAATPYWRKIRIGSYQVTERASLWMKHILKHDAKQPSAIGDVVKLVRDRLLQVDLPPDSDVYTAGKRTNAKDMREQLARILERASREPEYLFDGIDKFGSNPPPGDVSTPIRQFNTSPDYLPVPTEGRSADKPVPIGHRTRIENERVYTDSMTDIWQYPDDDHFAKRMIGQDQTPNEDDLCDHCEKIDIKSSELVFNRSSLETDCEQCAFCHLVKKAIDKVDLPHGDHIRLERDSDSFVAYGLDGSKLKILRVCCTDRGESWLTLVFISLI
jgi:serine/threonine protein kinase